MLGDKHISKAWERGLRSCVLRGQISITVFAVALYTLTNVDSHKSVKSH